MKLKSLLALVALSVISTLASAADLRQGTDYQLLAAPQAVQAKGKVEVIEFFSYMCPHCADFDPMLEAWAKTLPKDVVFRRLPIAFRSSWEPPARIYFALQDMKLKPAQFTSLHMGVFKAIHVDRLNFDDENVIFDWMASKGVDRAKFASYYNSFSVQSRVRNVQAIARDYGIDSVPTLVVQGKYKPEASSHEALLQVTNRLIAKARAELRK